MRVFGLAVSVILLSWFQPSVETLTARTPVAIADQVMTATDPGPSEFLKWAVTQGGVTVVALLLVYLLYRQLQTTKEDRDRLLTTLEKNAVAIAECTNSNNRLVSAIERKGI